MAKKEEKVVEKTAEETKVNEPKGKETKGDVTKVKEKMKMKPIDLDKETITKVNLSETPKTQKDNVDPKQETKEEEVIEEVSTEQDTVQNEDTPIIEEVTNEEIEEVAEVVEEALTQSMETGKDLPENIQKLMEFMEDTGGDLNDYVKLNQDYTKLDNQDLLYEYYKQTKPHLNNEEISFLMEDQFAYNEEEDSEKDIKRKKLALKEQVAGAKSHLDGQKSKYYEDIKAGSKLTPETQKAIDFFNRYNKESEETQKVVKHNSDIFTQKTNQVFNDKFKGFEYNVGEKKYRFNVKDVEEIKTSQSDINNFTKKFLDKNSTLKDAKGYHKSLFTAMNADTIANHFYEQGKADALKDSVAKSKNINMDPRQQHSGVVEAGGIKVRVLGEDSNDFKFKIKHK